MVVSLHMFKIAVLCLVTQLCLTLCNPMDYSQPGSSVHGDSPGKNIGVGCHALPQGIFPTQGLNPGLWHCRWILYHESPEKPKNTTGVSSLSLLQGMDLPNPGIKSGSPALQVDSLPAELLEAAIMKRPRAFGKKVKLTKQKLLRRALH